MGSTGVNADPSCHYERMSVKPVAVFLVLDWCCAVHRSDKMALRARRVMARAKARVIVFLVLYIAMEHRG